MKKILAAAICSLPFALAPSVYAQATTGGGAATGAPASTTASASPDGSGAAADRNDGTSMTPSTNATKAPEAARTAADRTMVTSSASDWSVKDDMIGEEVYNESDEKVGDIRDVLASHDGKLTFFVVGAGGFLGMGEHDVAIPFDRITRSADQLVLAGYTKDQLKELPKYDPRRADQRSTMGTTGTADRTDAPVSPAAPATGNAPATTPAPANSTAR